MGHDGMVQSGKKKNLSKGLAIDDKEENKRAIALDYVIDTNKRTDSNPEPKMTD